jgi:hypothetical protein
LTFIAAHGFAKVQTIVQSMKPKAGSLARQQAYAAAAASGAASGSGPGASTAPSASAASAAASRGITSCGFEYAEVLACPLGCLNGGGQIAALAPETPRQLYDRVKAAALSAGERARVDEMVARYLEDLHADELTTAFKKKERINPNPQFTPW